MKLFQIHEDDLAVLEQLCPEVFGRCLSNMIFDNALRIKFRRIQEILMNVRWNYGPPKHVESFPADGEIPEQTQ